jgi:hypothetical protein
MIIGGIKIFIPSNQVEVIICVADAATERQPIVTVIKEEKEKIPKSTLVEEEEYSDDMLTPWEIELKLLEDWLNNPGPEDGFQETVMQIAGEEHSTELIRNFSQEVEQEMIVALKHAAKEEPYQHED